MSLKASLSKLVSGILFPQACVVCRRFVLDSKLSPLCQACLQNLERLPSRICHYCGVPVPGNILVQYAVCSGCRREQTVFDWARAWGSYRGELRRVIRKFKFDGYRQLAHPLSSLLWDSYLTKDIDRSFDWVVPVPTHARRHRQRGFDHTLLLAKAFSFRSGIPIFGGLSRTRYTQPQFGLDQRERRLNLCGAFSLSRSPLLKNRNLIIIDDVLTTGTTVSELARLIREESSTSSILVLVVARALLASEG